MSSARQCEDEELNSDSSSGNPSMGPNNTDESHEHCMRPRSKPGRDHRWEAQRAEISNLRQEVATLSIRLQEKDDIIHQEGQKVASVNVEILRVRLAMDQDVKLYIDSNVARLRSLLSEAERERDWYKDGVEELRGRLGKSKRMNAALLDFLSQILVDGVYPECDWGTLKMKQKS
ncbi:hypothetical protein BKA70DRAFT_1221739 [Coprinopsis sp. MPI-PUGE-AT-0042]|nr:hypothetical protein BKA70DRAFT_1221739 [Coprinopsis sp. MPI-PUGE-AT-0042]